MKKTILLILFISNSLAIGLQGLIIPQSGQILSTAATGIAGNIDPALNPAIKLSKNPFIQYSFNNWLGDVKGSYTFLRWGNNIPKQLSIQTWNINDIELWGDSPDSSPMGTFSINYVSAAYSISHHFNTPYYFGLRIQTNYSHLFTKSLYGITIDAGTTIPIGSIITFGAVIRNIGYEFNNNLPAKLPVEMGLGTKIKIPIIKTFFLTDLIYNTNGTEFRAGANTNWKWVNLSLGTSLSKNKNAKAAGFSFNFQKWNINYGIYFHENSSILGVPVFLDVRRSL